jgi:hypothetical protein
VINMNIVILVAKCWNQFAIKKLLNLCNKLWVLVTSL